MAAARRRAPAGRRPGASEIPGLDRHTQAVVDRLILTQGLYAPLELLLEEGRLGYADYEAWRCGEIAYLMEALAGNPRRVHAQLAAAAAWCERLGLEPAPMSYTGWGAHARRPLHLARSSSDETLLATHYRPPAERPPQLDLFLDSGVTVLIKDLTRALAGRDLAAAEAALERLVQQAPEHRLRPAAELLWDALEGLERRPEVADPAAELGYLEARVAPLAGELLGLGARDFLAPFWRRLATALRGRAYDRAHDHLHASWAYRQCLDWEAVRESVLATPGHRDHPGLVARLAEASRRLNRRIEAIALWCELCWTYPGEAQAILEGPGLPDSRLAQAWRDFRDLDQELQVAWFPAWLLIEEPGLARALPVETAPDSAGPGRGFRLLQRLLTEGDDGQERLALRRALRDEGQALFDLYIQRIQGAAGR